MSQENGFSPVWTVRLLIRLLFEENAFPEMPQTNMDSLLCGHVGWEVRVCLIFCEKNFPQNSQTNGLSKVDTLMGGQGLFL